MVWCGIHSMVLGGNLSAGEGRFRHLFSPDCFVFSTADLFWATNIDNLGAFSPKRVQAASRLSIGWRSFRQQSASRHSTISDKLFVVKYCGLTAVDTWDFASFHHIFVGMYVSNGICLDY